MPELTVHGRSDKKLMECKTTIKKPASKSGLMVIAALTFKGRAQKILVTDHLASRPEERSAKEGSDFLQGLS